VQGFQGSKHQGSRLARVHGFWVPGFHGFKKNKEEEEQQQQ